MKYKTLFRLAVKIIGVYMVATGLPHVVFTLIQLVTIYLNRFNGSSFADIWYVSSIASLITPAIGLYLFFSGKWITNLAIPSNRPYCPECGYDISHNPTSACSECGTRLKAPEPLDTRFTSDTAK